MKKAIPAPLETIVIICVSDTWLCAAVSWRILPHFYFISHFIEKKNYMMQVFLSAADGI